LNRTSYAADVAADLRDLSDLVSRQKESCPNNLQWPSEFGVTSLKILQTRNWAFTAATEVALSKG